ncbi:ribosome-associated translation inhibitor RaiA [Suttonella sp. R2A3]|uniref:ribosome hibernation-promoting factor, HPF/YfiA family n=1 Tax=Suttonella sp. R2A3 TaxID=2908648 RepID=UPI001F205186|nr:ribosome-associated translation inhibitor RaiA [Suttonella sp. R2A3]UJF24258.1 ribosome-associated translation inhibitor RaiA [Suttonella sp. R2A3]
MQYNITGKQLDISEAMRNYVEEKLARIEGHHDRITSAQITLKTENHQKIAEGTLHVSSGKTFHGDAAHDDMYAAIDSLADKLDKQVRRHKRKITDHRE